MDNRVSMTDLLASSASGPSGFIIVLIDAPFIVVIRLVITPPSQREHVQKAVAELPRRLKQDTTVHSP